LNDFSFISTLLIRRSSSVERLIVHFDPADTPSSANERFIVHFDPADTPSSADERFIVHFDPADTPSSADERFIVHFDPADTPSSAVERSFEQSPPADRPDPLRSTTGRKQRVRKRISPASYSLQHVKEAHGAPACGRSAMRLFTF